MLNWELIQQRVEEKCIKVTKHPDFDLWIYNYTDKCTFDRVWDEATMNCRGLIVDADKNIVARGMPKFFNHNQVEAPKFNLYDVVDVSDKLDGSLGVCYPTPDGGWAVATRGSFVSEQAVHATALLNSRLDEACDVLEREQEDTILVEVLYPENRIVLDYGNTDSLPMLGVTRNGQFFPIGSPDWPWGFALYMGSMTYAEALAMPPRPNAEGLVLTRLSDGAMLKVKQEDYLKLHRIIYGLSARALWQIIVDGNDVDEYIASLPDEFQPWAKGKVDEMQDAVDTAVAMAHYDFEQTCAELDHYYGFASWERGEFARAVQQYNNRAEMFLLLDGKDLEPVLWRRMKPQGNQTPARDHNEDVA